MCMKACICGSMLCSKQTDEITETNVVKVCGSTLRFWGDERQLGSTF
jgi:hypothetical protein